MINADARMIIRVLPLSCLQIREFQQRYPNRLLHYVQMLLDHPTEYAGLIHVVPSDSHRGMFAILDGHTRFCASIMAGRLDALCLVIEEGAP